MGEDDEFEYYDNVEEGNVNLAIVFNIHCEDVDEPQCYKEAMN